MSGQALFPRPRTRGSIEVSEPERIKQSQTFGEWFCLEVRCGTFAATEGVRVVVGGVEGANRISLTSANGVEGCARGCEADCDLTRR